jgi:hypothetical protein
MSVLAAELCGVSWLCMSRNNLIGWCAAGKCSGVHSILASFELHDSGSFGREEASCAQF